MPDGRFLSKTVAHDLELNAVSLEADYLFMRCVPHLDVEGRMPGHPNQVKGMACPMRHEITPEDVDRALAELDAAGLVKWYEVDGRPCLEFPGFATHQKGLRKKREAESRIPSGRLQAAKRIRSVLRIGVSEKKDAILAENSGPTPDLLRTSTSPVPHPVEGEGLTGSLRTNSGPTPDLLRSTPDLLRPSEVKLSQAKSSEVLPGIQPPAQSASYSAAETPTGPEAGRQEIDRSSEQGDAARSRAPAHPALGPMWFPDLRKAVVEVWHHGAEAIVVHGQTIELGIEYGVASDLIHATGDPDFVRWLIVEAPVVMGWTSEPRSLKWARRPENLEQARSVYLQGLDAEGPDPTRGLVDLDRMRMAQ